MKTNLSFHAMQITIDLPQDLGEALSRQASESNVPLQTLIIQALRQLAQPAPSAQWSDAVLLYEGIPDFPAFEADRDELLPPAELELF